MATLATILCVVLFSSLASVGETQYNASTLQLVHVVRYCRYVVYGFFIYVFFLLLFFICILFDVSLFLAKHKRDSLTVFQSCYLKIPGITVVGIIIYTN